MIIPARAKFSKSCSPRLKSGLFNVLRLLYKTSSAMLFQLSFHNFKGSATGQLVKICTNIDRICCGIADSEFSLSAECHWLSSLSNPRASHASLKVPYTQFPTVRKSLNDVAPLLRINNMRR